MTKTLFLIATIVGVAVVAQICLKIGMSRVGFLGMERLMTPLEWLPKVLSTPQILIAITLFSMGFMLWLVVLSRTEISFAYPLLSAAYVFIPLVSHFVLAEPISLRQWAGILMITAGVVLVASSRGTG
jgi:drug/metabolite transporter (DMT)-like permease